MRFVHSLAKTQDGERIGWCAPVELGEDAPPYISFVLPMNDHADNRYLCEVVRVTQGGRIA